MFLDDLALSLVTTKPMFWVTEQETVRSFKSLLPYSLHLMYADDIVLLADNEIDLKLMLDNPSSWCLANRMQKSNVHFSQGTVLCFDFSFRCGTDELNKVEQYVYLGLTLI